MIGSFRHKGLKELLRTGKSRRIRPDLIARVLRRLDALHDAADPGDLNLPGFDFHALCGKPQRYSVHVNGPWCITFGWKGEEATEVDLEQYH
jgi:proteic killer suppression protein